MTDQSVKLRTACEIIIVTSSSRDREYGKDVEETIGDEADILKAYW